jgi:hypothetical protein
MEKSGGPATYQWLGRILCEQDIHSPVRINGVCVPETSADYPPKLSIRKPILTMAKRREEQKGLLPTQR